MSNGIVRSICLATCVMIGSSTVLAGGFGPLGDSEKIVHFHLSGSVTEMPQEDPFGLGSQQVTSLKTLLERLRKARDDQSVKAVVITFSNLAMGFGQLEELRDELRKFEAVNKRVFVHVESMSTGLYALLSSVSDLSVVPTSDLWLTGIHTESLYIKNLLDKIGCEADIIHIGDYKSAGEMLTRTGPSKPARENFNRLLDGFYDSMIGMIAESREMPENQVRKLIDDGPYTAERALKAGLIDSVQYRDEFMDGLKKIYGEDLTVDNRYGVKKPFELDFSNPFAFFQVFSEMFAPKKASHKDSIGIVYVEGTIVPGYAQPSPFGGSSGAFSGDIRKALDKAAKDDSIKAVVLRVDSPGGSALASEIILNAAKRVKAKKPLIISMGNVAGSGGYYVSCAGDTIFADETTITGSIGVVGGKVVTLGMWNKLGVDWTEYQRGENADLMSTSRKFSEDQRQRIVNWMEEVYGVFKNHVTEHRGDKLTKPIDDLAGGRVYTGAQALDIGLIDKVGGLNDAVEYAARRASLGDYDVRIVPEPKNFIDMLMGEMSGEGERPADITVQKTWRWNANANDLVGTVLPWLQRLDPERTKAVMQALTRIELIHNEGVIMMMPTDFVIH